MAESEAFGILTGALDDLVECGVLDPGRRPFAEAAAWTSVHGIAMLLDGPFGDLPAEAREAAIARTLDLVTDGLSRPAG